MRRSWSLQHLLIASIVSITGSIPLAAESLHVLVGGGLLGRIWGFCDTQLTAPDSQDSICSPGTAPLGGALGLRDAVVRNRDSGTWVLLTGNNLPKDFHVPPPAAPGSAAVAVGGRQDRFLESLAAINADVIALGQDDLLRAVMPADLDSNDLNRSAGFTPAIEHYFKGGSPGLRFLGSNAFIRTHHKGINVVRDHGYQLAKINPDETIAWTTSGLAINLPADAPEDVAAQIPGTTFSQKRDGLTITIKDLRPLQPDSTLVVRVGPAEFHLKIDRALTPWDNAPSPRLHNLPVGLLEGRGPTVIAAAMIDPAILSTIDTSHWSDKQGDDRAELVLLPIVDTLKTITATIGEMDAFHILLADVADETARQAIFVNPKWRMVAFNPDTHMLGCTGGDAGCGKGRTPGWELGSISLIGVGSQSTQAWIRPEWVGERLIDIHANQTSPTIWSFGPVNTIPVPGYAIAREREGERPNTLVSSIGDKVHLEMSLQSPYANATDKKGLIWWTTRSSVATVMMDAMRKDLHAEIAITDQRSIDQDVVAELAAEVAAGSRTSLRPSELMDILWRHDSWVRIVVKGSDLLDILGKLSQAPPDDDGGGYCARGLRVGTNDLGCSIPTMIDATGLHVNGSYFDPAMVYALAVTQGLAQSLQQDYSKKHAGNIFSAVNRYVRNDTDFMGRPTSTPIPSAASPVLPPASPVSKSISPSTVKTDWPNALEHKWLALFYIPPASIEVGGQNYHVPSQGGKPDASGFQAIPIAGEKVTHNFKFNLVGELHVVPFDLPAATLDLFTKENLNRLDTYPLTASGLKQIAYSPDLWTNGAALRSRFVTDAVSHAFDVLVRKWRTGYHAGTFRIEPFIGYFDDSSIFHFENAYRSQQQNPVTQQAYLLTEHDRKPNYAYLGFGLGFTDIPLNAHFKLKGTSLRHDAGVNYAEPTAVGIGASSYTMDQVRRCGIQNLIDGMGPGCVAAMLTDAPLTVQYRYQTVRQSRNQLGGSLEFARGIDPHKITVTLDFQGYQWSAAPGGHTPLDPLWSTEFNLKSAVPLWAGISIGPYVRYYIVKAFGSPGTFVSDKYGFTLTLPVFAKAGHGAFLY